MQALTLSFFSVILIGNSDVSDGGTGRGILLRVNITISAQVFWAEFGWDLDIYQQRQMPIVGAVTRHFCIL
ncbi:hypothetical protein THS27_00715 [Thalassospira sp. MCCC 1A01428]|nr:hypothetical protein THS27_00715 [Thalassospira sp. MCCC 1A01428]